MDRINTSTRAEDLFGAGKDGFTGGEPGVTPATVVGADWLNGVQEEIVGVIEAAGMTPDPADLGQLLMALRGCFSLQAAQAPRSVVTHTATPLVSVAYGAGLFVAVGNSAAIESSADGESWTPRTAGGGYTDHFGGICFGNSLFVAAGVNGGIQTSPDGITWTARTPAGGYTGTFLAVTWTGSLFVAVGSSGEIQTSPDGITWTHRTAAASYTGQFRAAGVNSAGTLIVILGASGEIQTSPDGITWTHRTPASAYAGTWNGIAYGKGRWVAVGVTGAAVQTSPDGITWTTQTPPATSALNSVRFLLGLFIGADSGGSDTLPLSQGGTEWNDYAVLSGASSWRDIASDGRAFVLVGVDGTDGVSIKTASTPI